MRLSRSNSVSERKKNQKLGSSRKKQKKLDAICEQEYNRNHRAAGTECNVAGESAVRRSSRVRRAPEVLDASPRPSKKRRRVDRRSGGEHGGRGKKENGVKSESSCSTSDDSGDESIGWRSRLRSRAKNSNSSPKGKRKLILDSDEFSEPVRVRGKEEFEVSRSMVVKSKRPGRIKASNNPENVPPQIDSCSDNELDEEKDNIKEDEDETELEKQKESTEVEQLQGSDEEDTLPLKNDGGVLVHEGTDANNIQLVEEAVDDVAMCSPLEDCTGNDNEEATEQKTQMQVPDCMKEGENQADFASVGGVHAEQVEENSMNVATVDFVSTDKLGRPRAKEGRKCGLCGTGSDGKPPKKLIHDGVGSDHEAYSGSSAAEEFNYDVLDGFGEEPSWLGRLLGPVNDRYGIAGIWVHQQCAVWSPEVYFAGLGCLKNIRAALCRGRGLKCNRCRRSGATIGCRVDRCQRTYHLPCARANGCIFDHRKFLIACTKHRYLFQPQGSQYHQKIKKMKAKKMKLELRKRSSDAWRKDLEAEEKWLENCGEDEEFLKRESKRLHRDLLRIAPVFIGGPNSENEKQYQGWESVAGLQNVIQCMKEVVILPLLYPEFFSNMGITPPRGVLLHGYPGTGKTLVVRSLIGSCASGGRRIAYFARKGADCLGKYVGDAERQLRLLFQVAEKSQPSIIFFDEIDGLAPCRTRQQDQTHNSVVSTLLALLDGLKSRGSVVVIGATNRPDAVDPALRRPGRFDREIYFPLPSVEDRAAILSLHTKKWPKPVTGPLLNRIARKTIGFAGADLQALCTQAAIIALRRNCPFQELLSEAEKKGPNGKRASLPAFSVEERDWLEALSCSPPPCSQREAGMAANGVVSSPLRSHLIPCLLQPLTKLLVSLYLEEYLSLSPLLHKSATLVKGVMVSTLNKKNISSDCWWSLVHNLLQEEDVQKEIVIILSRGGILHGRTDFKFDACGEDTSDSSKFKPGNLQRIETRTSLLQNVSTASVKNLGFRMLISGSPRSGQKYLASCILHCFVGNVELQKIDLATVSQEGHGDVVQGITEVLKRCSNVRSCMIFMPRFDLWAIQKCNPDKSGDESSSESPESSEDTSPGTFSHIIGKENQSSLEELNLSEIAVAGSYSQKASHFWSLFVQQVESICVSTSLMIVATSDVPFSVLPLRIRQFFKDGIQDFSSTPSEETIPRFSVDLDGNFNSDAVIDSSAAELLKDLVGEFIQLVHHRTHVFLSSCRKNRRSDNTLEDVANEPIDSLNPGSASEQQKTPQTSLNPECPVTNIPCTPKTSRSLKIKSSLLLAISTFGYQILRYPNFAELCWVTSKLRDGPSADIKGPWKGWPFNSCIVRPNKSAENGAVACSTSNIKSKESFGLVRGLTAVGLSAYRGVYTSLREVSFEVRKVLELLAEEIHAKIEAGKDRCHFIRILSQMAYFEDMVNSWAYTLQSLDVDAQTTTPTSTGLGCKVNTLHDAGCTPDASTKISHEVEVAQGSTKRCDLENGADGVDPDTDEGRGVTEGSPKHMDISPSTPDLHLQSSPPSTAPGQLDLNQPIEVNPEPYKEANPRYSNGFSSSEAIFIEPDGPSPSELRGTVPPTSVSAQNGTTMEAGIAAAADDSTVVCYYSCCSECVFNLCDLLHTTLTREWKLKNSCTVEDIHDMVASLLADLNSVIRKRFLSESGSKIGDSEHGATRKNKCGCLKDGSLIEATECSCHTVKKKRKTQKRKLSSKIRDGLCLRFVCRDGVLSPVEEACEDVAFHCKFETLCLCSLTEWIVMAKKQP